MIILHIDWDTQFPSFSVQSPLTNAYMDIALVDQTPVGYHNVTLLEQ